jgi:hypothetical protein
VFGVLKVAIWALAALALLRGVRWAYASYVVLGVLYLPATAGFHVRAPACERALDAPLAVLSLHNYAHIVLFALFFVMTVRQVRGALSWSTFAWAGAATVVTGALVELAEGVSGKGHCRLRDLVPGSAGAALGAAIVLLWTAARRQLSRSEPGGVFRRGRRAEGPLELS